ncbi:MAG: cytidine deaminase [Acutalibacteraceae bacterium]
MDYSRLIKEAVKAREFSYSPYSNFSVGAALLAEDGRIFTGCNIECASSSPTACAERTAFFSAVSQGIKKFNAIAIVGGKTGEPLRDYCSPCGVCRQVMREFCSPADFKIIIAKSEEDYIVKTLEDLLPLGFGPENL